MIVFYNGTDEFEVEIVNIKIYENLDEYFKLNDFNNILPGVKNVEEGRQIYLAFNSEDELKKYKFCGIEVRVI